MSIHFATPCYGGLIHKPCFASYWNLRETLFQIGMKHELNLGVNESLITRGRSEMAKTFLEGDMERLMWIDADLEFTPDDVAKLWNLDADIAVGIYAMKRFPVVFAAWVEGKLIGDLDSLPNPCEVDYAGTGFMMIKRHVFEQIQEANPELMYEGQTGNTCHFYGEEIAGTLLSEDYAFCRRWRALGGKITADTSVRLRHYGTYGYGE